MDDVLSRRGLFVRAGASLLAAPAIVRVAASLMPISTAAISSNIHSLLTSDLILREALRHLNNNILLAKLVERDWQMPVVYGQITVNRPVRLAHG